MLRLLPPQRPRCREPHAYSNKVAQVIVDRCGGGNVARVGIELDSPYGRNDGTVDGHAYFACAPQHGLLVGEGAVVLIKDAAHEAEVSASFADSVYEWEECEMGIKGFTMMEKCPLFVFGPASTPIPAAVA